jgi:hypothetical protein
MDNIKMDLKEIKWGDIDSIDLVENRNRWWVLVNQLMNLRVLWTFFKFLSSCAIGSFPRRAKPHGVSPYYLDLYKVYIIQIIS